MIPSNFRIEILAIRTLLCALGTKGLRLPFFPTAACGAFGGRNRQIRLDRLGASKHRAFDHVVRAFLSAPHQTFQLMNFLVCADKRIFHWH